jgi:hypothetical protein
MWRKIVCLFCLSHWDLPNHGTFHHALNMIGKPVISKGALRWFVNVNNYNARIINYWVFSKKFNKLNKIFKNDWGEHMLLLKSPQWVRLFRDDFINFKPKLGGNIKFWWIFLTIMNLKFISLFTIELYHQGHIHTQASHTSHNSLQKVWAKQEGRLLFLG